MMCWHHTFGSGLHAKALQPCSRMNWRDVLAPHYWFRIGRRHTIGSGLDAKALQLCSSMNQRVQLQASTFWMEGFGVLSGDMVLQVHGTPCFEIACVEMLHPCNRILRRVVSLVAGIGARDVGFGELSGAYSCASSANASY